MARLNSDTLIQTCSGASSSPTASGAARHPAAASNQPVPPRLRIQRPRRTTATLTAAALLLTTLALVGAPAEAPYIPGQAIVTFKGTVDLPQARAALSKRQWKLDKHFAKLSQYRRCQTGLVSAPGLSTDELLSQLRADPAVQAAEPNYLRHVLAQPPNDPLWDQLWGLHNTGQRVRGIEGTPGLDIKLLEAWSLSRVATNEVVVAVIDTGVDYTHPDLAPNMWINPGEIANNGRDDDGNGYADDLHGYNFAADTPDCSDAIDHGTHVAGTIAGVGDNQIGVVGVNRRARIMALRVSDTGETMSNAAILAAIDYVIAMRESGVNIVAINASYGGGGFSTAEQDAILAAGQVGIIFCAAAGNNSLDNDQIPFYPASYRLPNEIVVAATDNRDKLCSFSNYGATSTDIGAPGVEILSTVPVILTGVVQVASAAYVADPMKFSSNTTGVTARVYDCGWGFPTEFPAEVRGNLALIQRGTLTFADKTANAMAAGAVGVIIFNNTDGGFLGTLGSPSNWVPVVGISQNDGWTLKAQLPTLATLKSQPDESTRYFYHNGTSMAAPHVTGAIALAAMNYPAEDVPTRIARILNSADAVAPLQGIIAGARRLNLARMLDSDSNGLPDWWEQCYFGQLTGTDPKGDPDQDGASNLAEFLADTNPNDAGSGLRLNVSSRDGNLQWESGGDSWQWLERSTNCGPNAQWATVLTNAPGHPGLSHFTIPASGAGPAFYRLRTDHAPAGQ